MRKKLIVLSLLFATAAGVATYFFLNQLEQKNAATGETTPVVVAVREISPLRRITPADVAMKEVNSSEVLPGAVKDIATLKDAAVQVTIYPGEQLINNKLFYPNQPVAGLSFKVTPGNRAITIGVDDVQGLAGLIKPGDRVDVLATMQNPNVNQTNSQQLSAVLLVENVRLLAVNQFLERQEKGAKMSSVTLEVEPKQAQVVALASQVGRIQLVLRSPEDSQPTKAGPLGVNKLFGGGEPVSGTNNGGNS